jgi:hypothetical protein
MKTLQPEDLQPIEGFKVMEWLRDVREKEYELYTKDPEEYFRQLKMAGKRMRARIARINKASKNLN